MKQCAWCKRRKPFAEFYKRTDRPGYRSRCRSCDAAIAKGRSKAFDPDNPRLPLEPFAAWLEELVGEVGTAVAEDVTGLSQRRIYCFIQREQDGVTLDAVDRVLVREGSIHLSELYPELYELEEAA